MEDIPAKIPREAGHLNDGQSYERKLLLFIAASLSQNEEVHNFWVVSNPTGIDKIDDVVARVSFKDSGKKDIAVFVQAKLTSPDKLLWLSTPTNKERPTKYCYEIKLNEYEKAYNDVIQMMSSNKQQTQELRKLLKNVDEKDYFVCIFTNMEKVDPELQCKQFDGNHPIYFLDTRKCGQYRQFGLENEKFNSNFYKQLYVFLGQPSFEDIDSSIAPLLGEDYKNRLANLDEIVKDFMQKSELCWVLTKPEFEMHWFKVLAMDWMHVDLEKVKEINPKFERLWQKILAGQNVINLREDTIWPLLAYRYQSVIIKEVDEKFDWQMGTTKITNKSIKQKNLSKLRQVLFSLWRERKLPMPIRSDCTRNILKFLDQFKTVKGGFVVFTSEQFPDVISDVKQISDVELSEEAMKLEVSLQGRPPVVLSDISEWQTFSELKISQLLAWANSLEDGGHHIIGPVLSKPDENNIARTFTRKEDKMENTTLKQDEDNHYLSKQQREILTMEDVVKLAGPGLHIITGEPGIGKSTVLEELAHKYSSKDFVTYVILRDCLEDMERVDTWPSISADPIQYFFNKMARKSDDIISESIFQNHKSNKRLCLFLDGYNEILPLHGNKITSLIESILDNTAIPIFCTTTPYAEEQLTNSRNTICLELSPFSSKQIRQYLNRLKIEARDVEELFGDNFLSNPLHLNMLSEIYEKAGNRKAITKGKMYKLFIDLRHTKYNEKIGLKRNHGRRLTERSLRNHRLLALVDIFGRECITSKGLISDAELDDILDDICEHNIGIVDVSKTKGKFCFHHRTFAEYLVADWLLHMTNKDMSNNTYFKYVYEEVMRKHINICCIMNELSRCFVLWSEASKQLHINCGIFKLDEFGRNVAHAATSDEEQEKWMNSVCKSRLFYRKDFVLQWTCREFFHMEPNENGSAVVHEINKDYPTRTPLNVSEVWSSDGCTDLLTAIDSENKDDIKSILTSQLSLLETGLGIVIFHSAITTGNESIVKLLLDLRPVLLNEQDGNENTALHIACSFGCRDIVALLLENHGNLNILNKQSWSPLEMAAAEGHLEIVSLLLDHINEKIDVEGNNTSAEHYIKLLYREAVTIACTNGRWNVVTWLIEHGADPTLSNNDGWAAMHFAARHGELEIFKLLFKMGLNVNWKSHMGETPLNISFDNEHWDCVKWLLAHGADPRVSSDAGWTAMHYAVMGGKQEILTLLLDRGFNVNVKSNIGETPLIISIDNDHWHIVKWLLEHGADHTLSRDDGWACIHFAAKKGQLEILIILLDRGVNVNAKTNTGETPLTIAIKYDHWDIVNWLLEQGAQRTTAA